MKKYVLLIILILVLPIVYSEQSLEDTRKAADDFVMHNVKFHNNFLSLSGVKLFRKTHSIDPQYISFFYIAITQKGSDTIKASFILTLDKKDLKIISLRQIKQETKEKENLYF